MISRSGRPSFKSATTWDARARVYSPLHTDSSPLQSDFCIDMSKRYLLHFAHEHISFRWTEFLSLASKNDCKFVLISPEKHIISRPYILIDLEESNEDKLIKCVEESYTLKGLYEFWAQSNRSLDDLAIQVKKSAPLSSGKYDKPEQQFRVDCETFGSKISLSTKFEWMRKMTFFETFQSSVDLVNPKQKYCIFECNDIGPDSNGTIKEYYFGRHLAKSSRATLKQFSLKTRTFIANTSMDPLLSLIASNSARAGPNNLVYDPFVGSGSLLVAAANMGAYVMGADIDWALLHGKSKPSRKGETIRKDGESVRANFKQYCLENRYIDVMVSDINRRPFVKTLQLDSIITDPPYGVRESSEKIGSKKERKFYDENRVRYPSKTIYNIDELLTDLLSLASHHLRIGGRLVYFLPVARPEVGFEEFIPTHPSLELISFCDQGLTSMSYRLMVVMEKRREPEPDDKVIVPEIISDMKFREVYYGKVPLNNK